MYQNTHRRNIILASILFTIFCIGIIILAIINYINRQGKIAVTTKYAPYSAVVKINDKKVKNNGVNYLTPGKYTVTVSAPEFNSATIDIEIDETNNIIYGILSPSTEKGKQIVNSKQKEFLEVEAISSGISIKEGEKETAIWPILQYLPINNILYSIGYTTTTNNKLIITINTDLTYINSAVNQLVSMNVGDIPLVNYDIIIENYINPFSKGFVKNSSSDPLEFLRQAFKNIDCQIIPGKDIGNYYYTNIITGSSDNYTLVSHKVVLIKTNTSWELASTPYPILTTSNTPNIPQDILEAANSFTTVTNL